MDKRYHSLRITTFANATEDLQKVRMTLENLIGREIAEDVQVTKLEGVHHNPIQYLTLEFKRARDIKTILTSWKEMDFWKQALRQIDDRLDEDLTFHVRISKMDAYLGEISLWSGGEAIEIRLKPASFPASRDVAKQILLDGPQGR